MPQHNFEMPMQPQPSQPIQQPSYHLPDSALQPQHLRRITENLTKKEVLEERSERALSMLADQVLDDVVELACRLARHRGANTLKRDDIRMAFKKLYKINVPVKLH